MEKKRETPFIIMEIIDDILHVRYKPGSLITLETAEKIVADRLDFLEGKEYPCIIFDGGIVKVDKQAREYLSKDEGIKGLTMVAFMQESAFSRMLINFFLHLTNPKLQVKAFDNADRAIEWLKLNRK
jgi:hypothetical protein